MKVKGEISGLTRANSGHFYFNLKDEEANLASIIWRGRASFLEIMPEEGLEVVAFGKISTYMPRSNYNFIVENISFAGEGALLDACIFIMKKYYFEEYTKIFSLL